MPYLTFVKQNHEYKTKTFKKETKTNMNEESQKKRGGCDKCLR